MDLYFCSYIMSSITRYFVIAAALSAVGLGAPTLQKRVPGQSSAVLHSIQGGLLYAVHASIGRDVVLLQVDTGSSDLYVQQIYHFVC